MRLCVLLLPWPGSLCVSEGEASSLAWTGKALPVCATCTSWVLRVYPRHGEPGAFCTLSWPMPPQSCTGFGVATLLVCSPPLPFPSAGLVVGAVYKSVNSEFYHAAPTMVRPYSTCTAVHATAVGTSRILSPAAAATRRHASACAPWRVPPRRSAHVRRSGAPVRAPRGAHERPHHPAVTQRLQHPSARRARL